MHRRHFLTAATSLGALALAPRALAQRCGAPTEPNIEGPFFRAGAPFRSDLGRGLVLQGFVRDARCRPHQDAVVEVWQANADGAYDDMGFDFRARLRTGEHGDFHLVTVHPGRYRIGATYRPAHIHVKVHANGRPPLTTQLYFPGDPYNERDPWFRSSLLLQHAPRGCGAPRPRAPERMSFGFVV